MKFLLKKNSIKTLLKNSNTKTLLKITKNIYISFSSMKIVYIQFFFFLFFSGLKAACLITCKKLK